MKKWTFLLLPFLFQCTGKNNEQNKQYTDDFIYESESDDLDSIPWALLEDEIFKTIHMLTLCEDIILIRDDLDLNNFIIDSKLSDWIAHANTSSPEKYDILISDYKKVNPEKGLGFEKKYNWRKDNYKNCYVFVSYVFMSINNDFVLIYVHVPSHYQVFVIFLCKSKNGEWSKVIMGEYKEYDFFDLGKERYVNRR